MTRTYQKTFVLERDLWTTANMRLHWAAKAKRTKALRQMASMSIVMAAGDEPFNVARAVAYISYPRDGRADPANAAPTVKALIDGMVDAGLMPDDDHEHLIGPDFRRGPKTGRPGTWEVMVVLTEEAP